MSLFAVLAAIALLAFSGVPGLWMDRRREGSGGQMVATALAIAGGALGIAGALLGLLEETPPTLNLAWLVPGGAIRIAIDAISAVFLMPVFLMAGLGSLYGVGYWNQREHPDTGRRLRFFYGLLAASMGLVVIAVNSILFITAWEVMAVSAFFLVSTEDHEPAVRHAGWVYLVATHIGTLFLLAMMGVLWGAVQSHDFTAEATRGLSQGKASLVFVLALLGFGVKAGVMPLHVWLPGAHANAPSHVSAYLSGVLIKMGIYGLVRITGILPLPPVWWGSLILALGIISGIIGVAFAIGQHDLKRLLAYHSIENIGIILIGLGLALLGRTLGRPDWTVLGLAGALLHVWNHSLFKTLLFLSAGSVIHATRTREIDQLGGLAKRMPWTATAFLLGAVAICGLPPLNGFVSELMIYLGLFRSLDSAGGTLFPAASFAVPALGIIGALALACFVKVYGVAFLGEPRHAPERIHESPMTMLVPMAILAACCVVIGLLPSLMTPMLDAAIVAWQRSYPAAVFHAESTPAVSSVVPVLWLSLAGGMLVGLLALLGWVARGWLERREVGSAGTWDCGYASPTPRMQYTASSFGEMIVGLFTWVLHPEIHRPELKGPFPEPSLFESHVHDTMLNRLIHPVFQWVERRLAWFRFLQQGQVQMYIAYILCATLFLLLW